MKIQVWESMDEAKHVGRDSVLQSSDDWHEFTCTACDKDGKNACAEKYCIECAENLCASCVKQHNRFAVMKSHQMLDKCVDVKSKKQHLPSPRCRTHSGKIVDIYCPTHDVACCSVCVALEHSSCDEKMYLPDAAKGFKASDKRKQFENDLTDIHTKICSKREAIQKHIQDLDEEEERLLMQVKEFREKINKHLDDMQDQTSEEIKSEFKSERDAMIGCIEDIDKVIAAIKDQSRVLKDLDSGDEDELFVQVKTGKKDVDLGLKLLTELEHVSTSLNSCDLSFDYRLVNVLEESNLLAELVKETCVTTATFVGDYSVAVQEDKTIPMIGDLCEVNDGELIITDFANSRLKRLDENFCVTSYIDLQTMPYCVCYIGVNTLAVTLINAKVQFVLMKEPMVRTISFSVGERCRGIFCQNKELYVCCGGHSVDIQGRVEMYDLHGTHMRTYFAHISMPVNLSVNQSNGNIYITDRRQGLIILDRSFKLKSITKSREMEYLHGICVTEGRNLCVGDYQNNNIMLLKRDGEFVNFLLTSKDGIDRPMSLCYVQRKQALIVTMHKIDKIRVYTLSNK